MSLKTDTNFNAEVEGSGDYNPVQDTNSAIYDAIDRYKVVPRLSVLVSIAVYVYCVYTNKSFDVIEFSGYLCGMFVLVYVVGIDSLKDILDWWYKIQMLKRGKTPQDNRPPYDDYGYGRGYNNTGSGNYGQRSNGGSQSSNYSYYDEPRNGY